MRYCYYLIIQREWFETEVRRETKIIFILFYRLPPGTRSQQISWPPIRS